MNWIRNTFTLIGLMSLLAGCAQSPEPAGSGLMIHIFNINSIGGLGETQDATWSVLQQAPLSKSSYTITEDLLIDYDWDQQTFSISNTWGSEGLDAPFLMWGGEGAFLVSFNDQRLFGGRVVQQGSPRPFDYPAMVLRIESIFNRPESAGKLIYSFHPRSLVRYEPQGEFLADDPAVDAQVREHLAAIGKLK